MISLSQLKSFLNPFKGSTVSTSGTKGCVPAPTKNEVGEFYLNANGTWKKIDQGWNAFPIGYIYDNWTSNTLLPNFLFLEGAEISRTSYAELYNFAVSNNMIIDKALWTSNKAYGLFHTGDGLTTFGLPDWRGNFKRNIGGNAGTLGYQQNEGLPNITGSVGQGYQTTSVNGGWHNYNNSGMASASSALYLDGTGAGSTCTWQNYGDGGRMTFNASRANSIYGSSSHVTPINIATRAIIKYK